MRLDLGVVLWLTGLVCGRDHCRMSVDTGDWEVELAEHFRLVRDPVLKGIEERVIGAAYGSGAYTTRDQADLLGRLLDLGEGKLLVDIGSGPGWPGNYLAASTGCRVVITDPKVEEIAVAAARVSGDGLTAYPVVASGDMLPLRDGTFDAATSGDVFC